MDLEWMRTRLEDFLELLSRYGPSASPGGQFIGGDRSVLPQLEHRESTVKQILHVLDPDLADFQLDRAAMASQIAGKVRRGLGTLADREELAVRLAPEGPRLAADKLHPWVWDAARSLWASRHFRLAVQAAFTSVNAHTQAKVDRRDISDDKLLREVFRDGEPKVDEPRLRISGDPQDQTVQSKQRGAIQFGQGCAFAIRNPATHESGEWDEQEAVEQLAALSFLARLIDRSEVHRAEPTSGNA